MSSSSGDEVDRTIRTLMEEAMAQAGPSNKKKSDGWSLKKEVPDDSPTTSWSTEGMQYTVRNPANYGDILLKVQVFECGRPTHSCGLYLDENRDDEICLCLRDLLARLEDMWVDRVTGAPRRSGVTRVATPLAAWRKVKCENKRKKVADCVTSKKAADCVPSKKKKKT